MRAPHEAVPLREEVVAEGSWTILRTILWSAAYLAGKGVENARPDAEWLLAEALGVERLQLYLQHDRPLARDERAAYKPLLRRRAAREPLQYILGRTHFRDLALVTDPRVMIPRPETEVLVEAVLAWAARRTEGLGDVLEIGTGSGAVALSLASEGACGRVVATDVSAEALEVAQENARRYALEQKVEFRRGGLFDPLRVGERFDVVVSNPPYVEVRQRPRLEPEVRDWEPDRSLFAGAEGLDVLRPLVASAPDRMRPGGLLALEIGMDQAAHVVEMIEEAGAFAPVRLQRDLGGRQRVVMTERSEE